jgi:hypothetical protein
MRPGLFSLLEKTSSKLIQARDIREHLDNHFADTGTGKWKSFKKRLASQSFVDAVKQDERSDAKLKRWSTVLHKHLAARNVPTFQVPSQSSSKMYTVKYHPDLNRFTCSCGDFTYVQSVRTAKNRDCKHIQMTKLELDAQGKKLEKKAMSAAAARILRELTEG